MPSPLAPFTPVFPSSTGPGNADELAKVLAPLGYTVTGRGVRVTVGYTGIPAYLQVAVDAAHDGALVDAINALPAKTLRAHRKSAGLVYVSAL